MPTPNQARGHVRSATKVPKAKLAPQARAMRDMGMTVKQIAERLERSERYVYQLLRVANTQGTTSYVEVPDPKEKFQLSDECQEMVEFTEDGFEKFFNKYSGRV